MNLLLTSDFPSTRNQDVIDQIFQTATNPRIAWIPPTIESGRQHFSKARNLFATCGFSNLEHLILDVASGKITPGYLKNYDVIYLTGGNPFEFRKSLTQTGLDAELKRCLREEKLIIGASGGAMQFTPNVSLFGLVKRSVSQVLKARAKFDSLGLVDYEFLPHLNRLASPFLEKVRDYSEKIRNDIIAVADDASVIQRPGADFRCVGRAAMFRNGIMTVIDDSE